MRIYKILMFFIASIILGSGTVWAKYTYTFEETIIELTRDSLSPICNISYSETEPTNKNVIVTIKCNKEVEQLSGFQLSEDKKVLTKEFFQNESGILKIRDYSGNYTEVEYNVENIDKSSPQIIGCQNGGIYLAPLKLDYLDNSEISEIFVDKYSDNLRATLQDCHYMRNEVNSTISINVTEHPKNTKKYRYYINDKLYTTTAETKYIFTDLEEGINYKVSVEALDEEGNVLDIYSIEGRTNYCKTIDSKKSENAFTTEGNMHHMQEEENVNVYEITEPGEYQIIAKDLAGNETVYYIKVE